MEQFWESIQITGPESEKNNHQARTDSVVSEIQGYFDRADSERKKIVAGETNRFRELY
jgi:hypothetical protein